jgi:predicted RNA-binding protein with PUA domain
MTPKLKIHLEVHFFELKLFEGSDFDFLKETLQTPPSDQGARLIGESAREWLPVRSKVAASAIHKERNSLNSSFS